MMPRWSRLIVVLVALTVVSGGSARAQAVSVPDAAATAQHYEPPPLTDEDRQAAFPDVGGHAAHDDALHTLVWFDRLEWQLVAGASGLKWDNQTWVGRDRDRH